MCLQDYQSLLTNLLNISVGDTSASHVSSKALERKHLVENLSLSEGMRAFLNKHPVESVYGKFESGEFSRALVDLVASTYGNTSKIDLKVDDLMSLPSIEKGNYATVILSTSVQQAARRKESSVGIASRMAWWQKRGHSKALSLVSSF